ncbi:phytol kinase [Vigna angularis]|uniref:Phytol kinase n=1 Tax=Phaseolus angularis TaxID=3914 RepID=A0A8T0K5N5_PHAAN|nr:phytol kinase [Vigna angularis]
MFRSTTVQMVDRIAYLSGPPLQPPTTRLTFLSPSSLFLFKLKPTSLFSSSSSFFSLTSPPRSTMLHHDPLVSDIYATAISAIVALSFLRLWQETAKRDIFDKVGQKIAFFVLGFSGVFSMFLNCNSIVTENRAPFFAALIPGVNIIRMLVTGLGIVKDEATVKSMSRFGDYRLQYCILESQELLKGPLYYATTITLASIIYWRTSPVSIAAICNLCAGDGMADIVGRRFGGVKIYYNKNKSYAGSIAMASAGFLASIAYMWYFSSFGYMEGSWKLVLGFLLVSVGTAFVESLPISTELDDNLTVPLTSILLGSVIF